MTCSTINNHLFSQYSSMKINNLLNVGEWLQNRCNLPVRNTVLDTSMISKKPETNGTNDLLVSYICFRIICLF